MKKLLLSLLFFALAVMIPLSVAAEVDVKVRINIPLPPAIIFPAPPHVVVIPETHVYSVPDVDVDIFFFDGWWWRPWEGRWYRSRHYDRGWGYYKGIPSFHRHVPPGWRKDYRERRWRGYEWDHRPIPHHDVERNWRSWKKNKHWEKQNHWGVKGYDRRGDDRGKYRDKSDRGRKDDSGRGRDRDRDRDRDDRRDRR